MLDVTELQDYSNATIILPCLLRQQGTSGRGAARLARLHGVQEVGGSNPLAPTERDSRNGVFSFYMMIETAQIPPFNRKALTAFILSIISVLAFCIGLLPVPLTILFCYPPGILLGIASFVLGMQALRAIHDTGERGRVLALIAMWISGLVILATLCVIVSGILLWPYIFEFIKSTWNQLTP